MHTYTYIQERMTLMSPVPLATTHSHRPSSTAESDGYFSEVFDNEDSQDTTILSDTLSSLLNGPLANSPTTTTFINKVCSQQPIQLID